MFVVPPVLIVHLKRFQKVDTPHVLGSTRLGNLCCLASKIKTLVRWRCCRYFFVLLFTEKMWKSNGIVV